MPNAQPAHALRAVAAPLRDVGGLLGGLDHRHHDAHRAGVEHRRDQVIMRAGHARHWHEPGAARECGLLLQCLDAAPRCSVSKMQNSAPALAMSRQARREELERHMTEAVPPCAAWREPDCPACFPHFVEGSPRRPRKSTRAPCVRRGRHAVMPLVLCGGVCDNPAKHREGSECQSFWARAIIGIAWWKGRGKLPEGWKSD